ncbi:MAG: hypothetical protein JOZ35_21260 [Hyphomicrobiales bacterium]|nr:hypothetical protein [Hyphomicrobiales bacterium]
MGGRSGADGGLGDHFRIYASEKIAYVIDRYADKVNRLFGVMNRGLAEREYFAGPLFRSPTSPASAGPRGGGATGQEIAHFPHLARWLEAVLARPAVQRGLALEIPGRKQLDLATAARRVLFGQRAR